MNQTIAIARREIWEKSFVFIAAAALAIVACIMPFVPGVQSNRREVVAIAATVCAIGLALGMSLMLGASVIGRELTDRRLSFYFAKPISAPAIWFGKLIACAVLIAGAFAIAIAPAIVATGDTPLGGAWPFPIVLASVATALFFLAHVIGTIARSRSPWALADFVALTLFGLAGWMIAQPLLNASALQMLTLVGKIASWLLFVAVLAAGAWQLSMGRTDRQQSHRALSFFLWPAVAAVLVFCGLMVWWVVTPKPSDMTQIHTAMAGNDEWAIVGGPARHRLDYRPSFLVNTHSGAYQRLGGGVIDARFTSGGKLLIARRVHNVSGPIELFRRDLASGAPEVSTGLIVPRWSFPVSVSDDGTRVAYTSAGVLSVYEMTTHHSLGSFRIPAVRRAVFVTPDLLRVYALPGNTLIAYECDVQKRSMRQTGSFPFDTRLGDFRLLRGRIALRTANGDTMFLDGKTAAPVGTAPGVAEAVLNDGRIVSSQANLLHIGQRDIALSGDVSMVREILPATLLVETSGATTGHEQLFIVDANAGRVLHREDNVLIVSASRGGELLGFDATQSLIRFNAITGEKNVVVKPAVATGRP